MLHKIFLKHKSKFFSTQTLDTKGSSTLKESNNKLGKGVVMRPEDIHYKYKYPSLNDLALVLSQTLDTKSLQKANVSFLFCEIFCQLVLDQVTK